MSGLRSLQIAERDINNEKNLEKIVRRYVDNILISCVVMLGSAFLFVFSTAFKLTEEIFNTLNFKRDTNLDSDDAETMEIFNSSFCFHVQDDVVSDINFNHDTNLKSDDEESMEYYIITDEEEEELTPKRRSRRRIKRRRRSGRR